MVTSVVDAVKIAKQKYGKAVSRSGYIYIQVIGHNNSDKNDMIAQHTFVMSCIKGRPLINNESVHHKNGIRHDNSPNNLELVGSYHFSGQRENDMVEFCTEFLMKRSMLTTTIQ